LLHCPRWLRYQSNGDLTQLGDGFGEITPFGGVQHGGAVQVAVEQLILGAHTSAYRMQFLFG
jgi:hypothetical protein